VTTAYFSFRTATASATRRGSSRSYSLGCPLFTAQKALELKDRIIEKISALPGEFVEAGKNAWKGLVDGLGQGVKAVADAGRALAGKLIAAVKDFLGIHSPSRVFEGIGGHVVGGLVRGLKFTNAMSVIKKFFGGVWGFVGKVPSLVGDIFGSGDAGTIAALLANVKNLPGMFGGIGKGLAEAWSMVGKPYVWGAMSQFAADCSGLVSLVLNAMGLGVGRLTTATIPGALAKGRGKAVSVGLVPGKHTGIEVLGQWFEAKGKKWGILGPGSARSNWPEYFHPKGFSAGGVSTGPTSGYPALLHGTEWIFNRRTMGQVIAALEAALALATPAAQVSRSLAPASASVGGKSEPAQVVYDFRGAQITVEVPDGKVETFQRGLQQQTGATVVRQATSRRRMGTE
jgi:hypothetical protein